MGFEIVIGNLDKLGVYDFLLPFLFMMAVVYGLLTKTKVFGEEVSVNGVISLVIAFFITNYTPIGLIFTDIFGILAIVLAVMLIAILVLAMAGVSFGGEEGKGISWDKIGPGPIYIMIGVVALIIVSYFGIMKFNIRIDMNAIVTLIMLGIIVAAVWGLADVGGKKD